MDAASFIRVFKDKTKPLRPKRYQSEWTIIMYDILREIGNLSCYHVDHKSIHKDGSVFVLGNCTFQKKPPFFAAAELILA